MELEIYNAFVKAGISEVDAKEALINSLFKHLILHNSLISLRPKDVEPN